MGIIKKILSAGLALMIILSMLSIAPLSAGALESGDFEYKLLSGGNAVITKYNGTDSTITIPKKIAGYNVSEIGDSAFDSNADLKRVTVSEGISSIGQYAFGYCENLTSIAIPKSMKAIDYGAFSNCDNLEGVYISDLASWCSITFTDYNDAGRYMNDYESGNPFTCGADLYLNNSIVKNLVIPGNVVKISNEAFLCCKSIESVTISGNTEEIGSGAFEGCENLKDITVPDRVTHIGSRAFDRTVWYDDRPDGIVCAGKVLYNYKHSKTKEPVIVIVEDKIKGIAGSAFSHNKNLHKIVLPDSLVSIGDLAFYDCPYLLKISIPKSVNNIGTLAFGVKESGDGLYENITGFKVYGYEGTATENYASDNNLSFKNAENYTESKTIKIKAGKVGPIVVLGDDTDVSYKTSNKKVVKVSSSGLLSSLKKGTATITIQTGINTYKYKAEVTTNPKLKINNKTFSKKTTYIIKKGKKRTFKIIGKASSVKNTYKSTNKRVAKVISKRTAKTIKIKGYRSGRATITVIVNGVSYKIKVKVR